jgi:hypothetical protein
MSFQSITTFNKGDETYFTISSEHKEYFHDMVLCTINNLLAILEFSNHKFDDEVVEHLKMRLEELRYT